MGGQSRSPFDSFNLALHVGDVATDVEQNRQRLMQRCQGLERIQYLNQVHGKHVISIDAAEDDRPSADASITHQAGIACAVMTADCLPLLFCDEAGEQIAAVHAGWRGMDAGIVEATLKSMAAHPSKILVWMGPAISQQYFEIGPEVKTQLMVSVASNLLAEAENAFSPSASQPSHFMADLCQLARLQLSTLGVTQVYGGEHCCYANSQQFFSYRRDGVTGRMLTMIYKAA
jgi:YfiH family protein